MPESAATWTRSWDGHRKSRRQSPYVGAVSERRALLLKLKPGDLVLGLLALSRLDGSGIGDSATGLHVVIKVGAELVSVLPATERAGGRMRSA